MLPVSHRGTNTNSTGSWGEQTIPPLQFDASFVPGLEFLETAETPCEVLALTATKLQDETSEAAVPNLVTAVEAAIRDCEANPSGKDPERQTREARRLIDSTERVIEVQEIGRGQQVSLEIARLATSKVALARWNVVYRAPALGRFVTSYGLAVVYNDSEILFSHRESDGTYKVAEREPDGNYDPAGVVAFTWLAENRKHLLGGDLGATGGIGWDGANAAVFIGPSVSWGDNLTLTLGLGLHPEQRADRRYRVGDDLPLALSEDDLNDEDYAFGALFAITFRTGSKLEPPKSAPTVEAKDKTAKLKLTATSAATAAKGGTFDINISLQNEGNGTARNVSAIAIIPKQAKLASGTKWTCDKGGSAGDTCRLAIGDIPGGQVSPALLKLEVGQDATGIIEIQPSARGENVDEVKAAGAIKITVQ